MILEDVHYIEVSADAQTHQGPTLVRIHHGDAHSEPTMVAVSADALVFRSLRTRSEQADAEHLRIFFEPVNAVAEFEDGLLSIMPAECLNSDGAGKAGEPEADWHWGTFSR